MYRLFFLTIVALSSFGCKERESVITIVDIGENNRIELGKQLRTIGKYSPRLIVLDFHLVPDSLEVDSILVNELSKLKNTVQIVSIHNYVEPLNYWDSLEVSNSKFEVRHHGFSNFSMTDDSVLIPELPMRQYVRDRLVSSLSYAVAENSFGVKEKYKGNEDSDFIFKRSDFGHFFKIISRDDLASGNFNKKDLNNKIVIMGYVGEKEDWFYLDEQRTKKISGAEIQASFAQQIIDFQ